MMIDLCTQDLFFQAKIRGLLGGLPAAVRSRGPASPPPEPADLTILDLGLPIGAVRSEIAAAGTRPVIAFGPHVARDLLAEARALGCAAVLSHGALEKQLRPTVSRLLGLPEPF